jgi:hypothetical protein
MMITMGGNDSHTSLTVIKGDLSLLIGQETTSAEDFESVSDYYPDYTYTSCENYFLHIKTSGEENETLHILSENCSNGYYGGGSAMRDNVKKNSNARMIFVLGLPGSGKSTFCKTHFDDQYFHIFDDPLFKSPITLTTKLLEAGQSIVVNDPRLYSFLNFKDFYEIALQLVESPDQISYLF